MTQRLPSTTKEVAVSQLFAFNVAKPLEAPTDPAGVYDPVRQQSTWENGSPVVAVWCGWRWSGRQYCNAYGSYCTVWGSLGNQACVVPNP